MQWNCIQSKASPRLGHATLCLGLVGKLDVLTPPQSMIGPRNLDSALRFVPSVLRVIAYHILGKVALRHCRDIQNITEKQIKENKKPYKNKWN